MMTDDERHERVIFNKIDSIIEPFKSYRHALVKLSDAPDGYKYCFAFHYVNAEILNGGISQLYGNSSWCLILDAISASEAAGYSDVSNNLREIVYYYHLKGRSKLKRRIGGNFFADIGSNWNKTLQQLDDEYFKLENSAENVVPALCSKSKHLFD